MNITVETVPSLLHEDSGASTLFEPFARGERLGDNYVITDLIGRGGFAWVYEAHDVALGRRVAIKVAADDGRELQAEARALAAIRHPGVVAVYAFGSHRGHDYLVMEMLRGVTLDQFLHARRSRGEPLTPSEVTAILRDLACILAAIHALGVVHRDVKPSNVMLGPGGRMVLFDFGLFLPKFQSDSGVCGTPSYMSPESVLGDAACPARDIYSLGVVGYELLTGNPPFHHPDPNVTMIQAVQNDLPSLREKRPDIPGKLARLLSEMLDKDPARRPEAASLEYRLDEVMRDIRDKAARRAIRVLVVDDDLAIVRLLSSYLISRLPGCEVESALNASDALERIKQRVPDVLLLDLNMPKISGVELVMYLRGSTLTDDCMVVSVSAAAQTPDLELLQRLGVERFVPKGAGMLERVLHHCLVQRTILDSMTSSHVQ